MTHCRHVVVLYPLMGFYKRLEIFRKEQIRVDLYYYVRLARTGTLCLSSGNLNIILMTGVQLRTRSLLLVRPSVVRPSVRPSVRTVRPSVPFVC